jgi:hypothetical protein
LLLASLAVFLGYQHSLGPAVDIGPALAGKLDAFVALPAESRNHGSPGTLNLTYKL